MMADAVALGGTATLAIDEVRRLYLAHAAQLRLALARLSGPGVDADDLLQEVFVVALRKAAEHAIAGLSSDKYIAESQGIKNQLRSILGPDNGQSLREQVNALQGITSASDGGMPFEIYAADIVWDMSNLKRAALVIFIYSTVFTGFVSILAVMLIPDAVRVPVYANNLIAGLVMSLLRRRR